MECGNPTDQSVLYIRLSLGRLDIFYGHMITDEKRVKKMGLFSKKDPAEEYPKNKKSYMDKISVSRSKQIDPYLRLIKAVQVEHTAKLYVEVTNGCLVCGDLLEIQYQRDNKLGVFSAIGQVKAIFQVHGTGKQERLVETAEAYEKDLVWIEVPDVDVSLIMKNGEIRKSRAKNLAVETSSGDLLSVSYDEEVSKMVNYFKAELYGYFTKNEAIEHITQDLSYALLAQKRRLNRIGITMTIEKSTDIGATAMKMDVNRYSSSQYDVAEVNEPVKLKRTYKIGDYIVYQDEEWRICYYLMAGAKYNNDGLIECPNCASYAKREELLTGCPYCNTQFTIQDLSLRVAGYSQKRIGNPNHEKQPGRIKIDAALAQEGNQKEFDHIMKHRMKEIDPLFSPTAFYNRMRSKLYAIVFAESDMALQNLADVDFDVKPYYKKFEDVIDIDIQEIQTANFKKNVEYILTDVIMKVMVLRLDEHEKCAKWTNETITLSFVKHIKNKTKNIFEPGKIQCESCGASYSLYEGRACAYCSQEIDYPMYDWLLIDMVCN